MERVERRIRGLTSRRLGVREEAWPKRALSGAICGGCPEFDWDGWGQPDPHARITEILGYDWEAKWDEL